MIATLALHAVPHDCVPFLAEVYAEVLRDRPDLSPVERRIVTFALWEERHLDDDTLAAWQAFHAEQNCAVRDHDAFCRRHIDWRGHQCQQRYRRVQVVAPRGRRPRPRGAGRPRVQRSSARSGDSGDHPGGAAGRAAVTSAGERDKSAEATGEGT